ncbi:MAG: cobalamin biosynthesis protein [Candidatus Syntrophoarchaeum sp. WYZ-LMO15]|nr:MAG: cobalamin biosynthesis protein [Candidatus Syntrophoarchaeum sp. WYZ-LMO15]
MIMPDTELGILLLAVLFDITIGEPPRHLHPVVWMGWVIDQMDRRIVRRGGACDIIRGTGVLATTILLFGISTFLIMEVAGIWPLIEILAGGIILKTTFSYRYFRDSIKAVLDGLRGGDIEGARSRVSMLVSRETSGLDAPHLVSATIESAAENLVDGIIAPLLFFAVFGIVGAVIYRVVNTADSMLGYRDSPYRDVGFASARLDDILNFIPARIGGVLICLACGRGFDVMIEDRKRCTSPNSCYPMGAMAGGLGIWLEKPGYYRINERGRAPDVEDIERCLEVMGIVFLITIMIGVGMVSIAGS